MHRVCLSASMTAIATDEIEVVNVRADDDSDDDSIDELLLEEDPKGDYVVGLEPKQRRKWKQARYVKDKKELLESDYTVEVKASDNKKLRVGVQVQTRARPHYEGEIIQEVGKSQWKVRLTVGHQEEERTLKSQQLKVLDDSEGGGDSWTWKIVEDHVPDPAMLSTEYSEIGLIGFDFEDFDIEKTSYGATSYDFPYLRLMQTLWPGDWRKQLIQIP